MSLTGFKAQNHPQQVGKREHQSGNDRRWHATEEIDDRAITLDDFGPLHERFRFTVDACASTLNARLPRFWTRDMDALTQDWSGERLWCNPPYSNIRPFVEKAWATWNSQYACPVTDIVGGACTGCRYCEIAHERDDNTLIVMLLPANRTEQGWWQDLVEPALRDGRIRVEFLRGRMRFLRRGQTAIGPNERPPFGCCLLIWGDER